MTEHSGVKINPVVEPANLDDAYSALERLSKPNGTEPPRVVGSIGARVAIKSIEEEAPPTQGNSALIGAVAKVYAVVTHQIAYHEREAARLRESLKPFAAMAPPRQPAAPESLPIEDGVRQLLALADRLGIEGEQDK